MKLFALLAAASAINLESTNTLGMNLMQGGDPAEIFAKFDQDSNGHVTLDEVNETMAEICAAKNHVYDKRLKARAKSYFEKIDKNHDGNVNIGELEEFMDENS